MEISGKCGFSRGACILTVFVAWSMPFAFGSAAGHVPTWAIMFVLNAVIMNSLIRKPDGASMGLLTAGLAALVQIAVEAAVIVVLAIVLGLSIFEAVQNAH